MCLTQKVLKSVYSLIINLIGFALMSNTCGGLWSNGVGQNRESDEEDDQDCVEGGLVMVSSKVSDVLHWAEYKVTKIF